MTIKVLLSLLLLWGTVAQEEVERNDAFFRCGRELRCGITGTRMRRVYPTAGNLCRSRCVWLPLTFRIRGWECGTCEEWNENQPGFSTTVEYADGVPSEIRDSFTLATEKWSSVITGDLRTVRIRTPQYVLSLLFEDCALPRTIDDIFICVSVADIDGPGGAFAARRVYMNREEDDVIPLWLGYRFDSADLTNLVDNFDLYVLIMRDLAYMYRLDPKVWLSVGLIDSQEEDCSYKANSAASREFRTLTGCSEAFPLPLNELGSAPCSYFDPECIPMETSSGPFLEGAILSTMTVGALDDLGYAVNYSAADLYDDFDDDCISEYCFARRLRHGNEETIISRKVEATDSAKEAAVAVGKKMLEKSAEAAKAVEGHRIEGMKYMADKGVMISYFDDDGNMQEVEVTPET